MKKVVTFLFCLLAALVVDFMREGITSRVYAQFVIIDPAATGAAQAPAVKGAYPAPGSPGKLKAPYPIADPGSGPYPVPVSRPAEKKAK
ncbi:MAG: hypothetical protein HY892_19470 [Deltaproteobacteria bacterium]|nr:hypothetical protein [Deltaproteobacteria bacterium]